jgi:cyclopropane-fatty-acyl-phospholipid synthase
MNYIRAIDEVFKQFKGIRFSIKFWNGEERQYGSGTSNVFTLIFSDAMTAKNLLTKGSIGFGEAYMDGSLQIDGDLESYIRLRHQLKNNGYSLYFILATLWAMISTPWSRKGQIAHHYDIGNDFFKMILDGETMSYSTGYYEKASDSLAAAQKNKLDFICRQLNLPAKAQVLDLGSGWGGFALYAAKNYLWSVVGYTLSKKQLDYCNQLVMDNHLENRLFFEYRDMLKDLPNSTFDGIVMIESIEHAGQKNLPDLFQGLINCLKPGSSLVIQSTVRRKIRSVDRWTLKYIFPGGYLPSQQELVSLATEAGFRIEEAQDETQNYIYTITEWIENFEGHREEIEKKYGQPFYRMWKLWIHGTKVSFETGAIGSLRLHLVKAK